MFKKFLCAGLSACVLVVGALADNPRMPPTSEAKWTNIVDVSHHNTLISWANLRQNTSIVYIKATEGLNASDATMPTWANGAQENQLDYGFYHYFWPSTQANALAQAKRFVSAIKGYSYTCLPAIDIEESNGCSRAEITEEVQTFRDYVKQETGYNCMIYVSVGRTDDFFTSIPTDAPLWLADYTGRHTSGPRRLSALLNGRSWVMWQYSENESRPGILGDVDADKASKEVFIKNAVKTSAVQTVSDSPVSPKGVYGVKLTGSTNSRAGANFDVLDAYGNTVPGRQVFKNDKIQIQSVDYARQLAEVVYPAHNEYVHAYIHNRQDLLHNNGWHKWRNGRTREPVYGKNGKRIGTIYPHEYATILGSYKGYTHVLYSTSKGAETKDGYVKFRGIGR